MRQPHCRGKKHRRKVYISTFYEISTEGTGVRISYGGNTITLPRQIVAEVSIGFEEALTAIENNQSFTLQGEYHG